MIRQNLCLCGLLIAILSVAATSRDAVAGDYVWARTNWGSSGADRHYSSFSNGYGGFYVPRNGYGNNYEGGGRFTNPNGYIVPAQGGGYSVARPTYAPAAPLPQAPVRQPAVAPPVPNPPPIAVPPKANQGLPNPAIQTPLVPRVPVPTK